MVGAFSEGSRSYTTREYLAINVRTFAGYSTHDYGIAVGLGMPLRDDTARDLLFTNFKRGIPGKRDAPQPRTRRQLRPLG